MKQITVLVRNEVGVAAQIATVLAAHDVNIDHFDIDGMEDRGVVVLTVDKYDLALALLRSAGFKAVAQNTVLVRLEDRPGALARVAVRLKDAALDLRSLHIVRREHGVTIASLVTSDQSCAMEVLRDILVVEPA
ncbi:MAG: ACT domain-containing protein [Verrucomicrobiota bacterium]